MQFIIKTREFSKILEKFPSVSTFRAMPQSSRFLPLVKNSFLFNVHVFKNQNIENETNYRGKHILDKHISGPSGKLAFGHLTWNHLSYDPCPCGSNLNSFILMSLKFIAFTHKTCPLDQRLHDMDLKEYFMWIRL